MKEKVLFIFISTCMLITSIHIHAGAIQEANQQLRSIFSNLHRPSSTVRIFYDMAAHRVDSTFYDIMCADTTSCDTWYYLYDEIYNSAYDTTTFLTPKSVFYSLQGFLLKRYTIEQTETNLIKLPLEKNNIVLVFVQKIDGTSFAKLIAR
jgi:hypothetical protein